MSLFDEEFEKKMEELFLEFKEIGEKTMLEIMKYANTFEAYKTKDKKNIEIAESKTFEEKMQNLSKAYPFNLVWNDFFKRLSNDYLTLTDAIDSMAKDVDPNVMDGLMSKLYDKVKDEGLNDE